MTRALVCLWASLLGIAGSFFMTGWALHAERWGIVVGSGLIGLTGTMCLGLLIWMFCLD